MLISELFRGNTARELPRWATDILAAMPTRGSGLNTWLLKAAIVLRRCGRSEHDIRSALSAATADQPIREGEIERAVKRSVGFMSDNPTLAPRRKWSTENETLRDNIIGQAGGLEVADLWERSPYRLLDDGPNADALIDMLFPGETLLCCASSLKKAHTAPRSWWRGRMAGLQFIVPSPMSSPTGQTQDGKPSARCLRNTGPRKYLVVEQDSGTSDEQAAILLHLSERAPLVMALTSGNKSLHGWFSCNGATESQTRNFFDYAVKCGADQATWTPCQLVRMPEGQRDNGKRQSVLFLSKEAL